ncbi:hypothetical protein [Geminisphaera colitermitum]|uniref:hypothetical protein n=1 Tax=Geminisphaera colitermitum TaxID=1148786 RepID=UPI000158CEF9|nr:hypothetical protein [Geminisphaera colitermitum]
MNTLLSASKFTSVDRFIDSVQKREIRPRRDPKPTSPSIVSFIIETTLKNPHIPIEGLRRAVSKHHGVTLSGKTVGRIIECYGLHGGPQRDYLAWLEREWLDGNRNLSPEEWAKVEHFNPALCERHDESKRPGDLLCQMHFPVIVGDGVSPVHAHVAIDTYSGHAIGHLASSTSTREAIDLLHSHVLPRYARWRMPVGAILTTRDCIYGRAENQPFPAYLTAHGIRHRQQRSSRPNGFIEQFSRVFAREFRLPLQMQIETSATGDSESRAPFMLVPLQEQFEKWIHHYNVTRPSSGYRNKGATPWARLQPWIPTDQRLALPAALSVAT